MSSHYTREVAVFQARSAQGGTFPLNRNPGIVVLPGAEGGTGFVEALAAVTSYVGRFRDAYRVKRFRYLRTVYGS